MIECKQLRQARPGFPVVIAVFSYRYEAHLVPGLIENIRPFVHGYVAWDDRSASAEMTSEPERRNRLLAQARQMGARWILATDPDERIETGFVRRLPEMLAMGETNVWNFALKEMFTPESYRVDGIWGYKKRIALFPTRAAITAQDQALHGTWIANPDDYRIRDSETNIYHLRMATPERRRLRHALYAAVDPTRQFQRIGYDYLDDERGMVLERIPRGREFKPAHDEDHGLWSPDPGKLGQVTPDPVENRLTYAFEVLKKRGHAQASHVVQDLAEQDPADPDLLPMAAVLARTAGDLPRARSLAQAILDRTPDNALALYLRSLATIGDPASLTDLARLQDLVGDCLLTRDLTSRMSRPTADFCQPDALWRRWVTGPATCREGAGISAAPMSVVVIGYQAQAGLAAAVASLRAQDPPCEIVVVNSGGGPVETLLADHLDHIRLISTDERLYVGAARNIGIDASRGGVIGFLAGDCRALPGWVAGRMRDHDLGARSVSNPVVSEPGSGRLADAATAAQRTSRSPSTPLAQVAHYGRSILRDTLSLVGYYPTGMRVSEDTAMNLRLDRLVACVWAPDVLTTHREPSSFTRLFLESFGRGKRMAPEQPFRGKPGSATSKAQIWLALSWRNGLIRKPLSDEDQFNASLNARRVAVSLTITFAKFLGVLRGIARQTRADRALLRAQDILAAASDPATADRALSFSLKAAALDPQDPAKLLFLGKVQDRLGRDSSDAFRRALALDPTQPEPLTHLLAPLVAAGDWAKALVTAETAAETAPQVAALWLIAAEMAAGAGRKALAVAHLQRALSLAPNALSVHAQAEALYQAVGEPAAAACRQATARRLQVFHGGQEALRDQAEPRPA